jgi:hypothetical protein
MCIGIEYQPLGVKGQVNGENEHLDIIEISTGQERVEHQCYVNMSSVTIYLDSHSKRHEEKKRKQRSVVQNERERVAKQTTYCTSMECHTYRATIIQR